jgi:hypothetical protein
VRRSFSAAPFCHSAQRFLIPSEGAGNNQTASVAAMAAAAKPMVISCGTAWAARASMWAAIWVGHGGNELVPQGCKGYTGLARSSGNSLVDRLCDGDDGWDTHCGGSVGVGGVGVYFCASCCNSL